MKQEWIEKKLGDTELLTIIDGDRGKNYPKQSDFLLEGHCLFLNTKNVRPDGFNFETTMFIDKEKDNALRKGKLTRRDVILTTRGTIGNIALYDSSVKYDHIRINSGMLIFRPNERIITSEYLFKVLLSPLVKLQIAKYTSGAAQPQLPIKTLVNFTIPVPPLPEQKRIVAILDEAFEGIDRAIANTEKNLANARELFESYLNAIFTLKGDGWEEKKLEDICSIKHGFAFKGEFFTNDPSHYILLTPGSFYESGGYREQGEKTKYYVGEVPDTYILRKGDFLFVMTEQAVGLLGSSLIVPESNRFLHNQRLGLVQLFNGFEWHNDFFFHQFNTQGFRAAVQSSASGVKVRHTSPKKLGAIKVFFPRTKAEQKAVADTLNELYAETQRLETIYRQKNAAFKELKQSILQKAFTGELTADNANQVKKTAKEVNAA